jgi:uroporphyrinogen-III decarboxylase
MSKFVDLVLNTPGRLAMPIGVYAGLEMTGATVRQAVTDPIAQSEAVLALNEHFHTPLMLTAMDLSAESEAFGCLIRMSDEEIPKVLESGASLYHFGAPMDILTALKQAEGKVILAGNLDPSAVFHAGTPETVYAQVSALAKAVKPYRNFIMSSGCGPATRYPRPQPGSLLPGCQRRLNPGQGEQKPSELDAVLF